MKIKIKSKQVKGLTFIIEDDITCAELDQHRKWLPPYCRYKGFCQTQFVYGLNKYCKERLR